MHLSKIKSFPHFLFLFHEFTTDVNSTTDLTQAVWVVGRRIFWHSDGPIIQKWILQSLEQTNSARSPSSYKDFSLVLVKWEMKASTLYVPVKQAFLNQWYKRDLHIFNA